MTEIIYITISLIVGYSIGWWSVLYLRDEPGQLEKLKEDIETTMAANIAINEELQAGKKMLQEIKEKLEKEKDIHQQVRKQIFAEREAGEKTINGLYERIRGYKEEIAKLKKKKK